MVKEQLKETKLMTKTFDTLQTEFDAVSGLMRPRLYFHQNPYTINLILFHLLFLAPGSSTTHRAAISNLLVVEVETFFPWPTFVFRQIASYCHIGSCDHIW